MTILCGTDFTGSSHESARAAAALAARSGDVLELVHVLDFPVQVPDEKPSSELARRWSELFEPEVERRQTLLENEADRLTELGCEVHSSLISGTPEDALIAAALEHDARLIVVASLGGRSPSAWRLGSVADHLAAHSPVPVLVVRSARPFETWSDGRDGGQPLSVLCGVDFGATSQAAAAWVAQLKTTGPCEVVAAHVYELEREARRLGVEAEPSLVEGALRQQWGARLADFAGAAQLVLRPRAARGPVAEQLNELARDQRADLIVVGSHQRVGLARHWHGSVSYGLVPQATTNVVVVPHRLADDDTAQAPAPPGRILAVSDLTPIGDRAIAQAFALAPAGCQITLLHVVQPPAPIAGGYGYVPPPPATPAEQAATTRQAELALAVRVPGDAGVRGVESHCEVVHAPDVALAVCQAAERTSADLICMATHAHGTLTAALLGSVARDVVRDCGRPVLLVPPAQS